MTSTRIRITRTEFFFSVHVILRSVLDNFNNWLIAVILSGLWASFPTSIYFFLYLFYICLQFLLIWLRGLNQAATNFYSFDQGRIAAYRLFEMISRSSSSFNHDGSAPASVQGNIEFRNVYFSYLSRPEIPILSGFYLTVPAKKTVALVGRNGSGKSSIIPLMERFYDPTLGNCFPLDIFLPRLLLVTL